MDEKENEEVVENQEEATEPVSEETESAPKEDEDDAGRVIGKAKIVAIGVGGAGCNAVNRMIEDGLTGIDFYVANTDAQALSMSKCQNRILLGSDITHGLGAGGMPDLGAKAATQSLDEIRKAVKGADMVFLAAGMGGGTGTGATPVIAKCAMDAKALTVAVVTKPFNFEGPKRLDQAAKGLADLRKSVDSYIVVSNDRLMLKYGGKTSDRAFRESDGILSHSVKAIVDLITKPGQINLDFADIKATLTRAGMAVIGFCTASGPNKAVEAARGAISSPLLEASAKGSSRILVNITASPDATLNELKEAVNTITDVSGKGENVMFGQLVDPQMKDSIEVTAICTGFNPEGIEVQAEENPELAKSQEKEKENEPTEADILPAFLANLLAGGDMAPLEPGTIGLSKTSDSLKLGQALNENKELRKEKDDLQKKLDELKEVQPKLDAVNEEYNKLKAEHLGLVKEKSVIENQKQSLQDKFDILVKEKEKLANEYNELSQKANDYEKRLQGNADEIRDLKGQIDLTAQKSQQESNRQRMELESNIQTLNFKIDQLNQDKAKKDECLTALQGKLDEANAKLEKAEAERAAKEKEDSEENRRALDEKQQALDKAAADLEAEKAKNKNLEEKLNNIQNDRESESNTSIQEIARLDGEKNEALEKLDEKTKEAEELNQKLAESEKQNKELAATVENLQQVCEDDAKAVAAATANVEELEKKVTDLEASLQSEKNAHQEALAELTKLHETLKQEQAKNQKAQEEATGNIESLTKSNAGLQSENESLKQQIVQLQNALTEKDKSLDESAVNKEVDKAKFAEELATNQQKLEIAQKENNELKAQLESLKTAQKESERQSQAKLEEALGETAALKGEVERLTGEKDTLEAEKQQLKEEFDQSTSAVESTKYNLDEANKAKEEAEQKANDLAQQLAELHEQLEKAYAEKSSLEAQAAKSASEAESKALDYSSKLEAISREKEEFRKAKEGLESSLSQLKQELAKAQEENAENAQDLQVKQALEEDLAKEQATNFDLKEQLEKSHSENAALQAKITALEAEPKEERKDAAVVTEEAEEEKKPEDDLSSSLAQSLFKKLGK